MLECVCVNACYVCALSSCWSLNVNGASPQLNSLLSEHCRLDQLVLVFCHSTADIFLCVFFSALILRVLLKRVSQNGCMWKLLEQKFVLVHQDDLCRLDAKSKCLHPISSVFVLAW